MTIKTLLINPPFTKQMIYKKFSTVGAVMPPMGLAYLAGYLEKLGKPVRLLDSAYLNLSTEQILKKINDYSPDIIGFSTVTPAFNMVRDLSTIIKAVNKDVLIVAGGAHFWGLAEESLADSDIDCIVYGEGEKILAEIVNTLEDGGIDAFNERKGDISGIVFKDHDGSITRTASRPLIKDMDSIPFPARHLMPHPKFYKPTAITYKRLPTATIFTTRGCPYRCVFCASLIKKVRFFSIDYVLSEIDHLVNDYGIRELTVLDDVFTIKEDRVLEFCDRLKARNYDLIWCANVQVTMLSEVILKAMKEAGCWMIMPGVESGNPEILKTIKKGIKLEQVVQASEWAMKYGLCFRPSYIIGNPGETEETIDQTIDFARSIHSHYPLFSLMTAYPGTELWERADEFGTITLNSFDEYSPSSNQAPFVPHGLTEEILINKQKEAYKKCYLDPRMIWRQLKLVNSKEDVRRGFNGLRTLLWDL